MEQYTLVLLKSGKNGILAHPGFMDVIKQHHAVLEEMTRERKDRGCRPSRSGNSGEFCGVTIFRVDQKLRNWSDDPTVKAGSCSRSIHA